jgi:hypothetical protein
MFLGVLSIGFSDDSSTLTVKFTYTESGCRVNARCILQGAYRGDLGWLKRLNR